MGLMPTLTKPVLHCFGDELWAVVRSDVFRGAVAQEQRVQSFQYILGTHSSANRHSQGLAGILAETGQHLVAPTTAELVVHEVDAPDVVRMRGAQPDDRTVLVVKPSPLLVPLRQLKSLFPPDRGNRLIRALVNCYCV